MKAETQANALASLVQKKKKYPEYELALPLFEIKQSRVRDMIEDDVLLLGLSQLEFILFFNDEICAKAKIYKDRNSEKIKISHVYEESFKKVHTKKYEVLKISFGILQSRKLEVDYKVSISQLDIQHVKVFVKDKNIAEGRLVKVDDEIAIQITKVNKNDK